MENCAQDLGNSTKAVSSAIAQLLGEVAQGNENYAGMWAGPGMGCVVRRMGDQELDEGQGLRGNHWDRGLVTKVPFSPSFLSGLPRYCSTGRGRRASVTGPGR